MGNVSSQEHTRLHNQPSIQQEGTPAANSQLESPSLSDQDTIVNTREIKETLSGDKLKQTQSTDREQSEMTDNGGKEQQHVIDGHDVSNVDASQDITMRDSSKVNLSSQPSAMNIDSEVDSNSENDKIDQRPRRRSTLILTDDPELEKLKVTSMHDEYGSSEYPSQSDTPSTELDLNNTSSHQHHASSHSHSDNSKTVPIEIQWFQGGENVFITGSFTGWRKMIRLIKEEDNRFGIKLKLPIGTHRFRFIVDNELRFSDYLPTATDQLGNFVNYIEIQGQDEPGQDGAQNEEPRHEHAPAPTSENKKDSKLGLTSDDDDMGNGYSRFHEEEFEKPALHYVSNIPAIFTDPSVMEQYYLTLDNQQNNQNQSWLTPPQLPPHLENVILNNFSSTDKTNSSGALPIPNHVVLNHLATTSIKHNTLAVASVVRYKRKYATQVLYAPLQ